MKKKVLIAAVALFGFNSIQAQEEGIRFGAKAGLNISNFTFVQELEERDEELETDSRTSFHLGVVVEIPLSKKFAFQPELVYSYQGAKDKLSDSFDNGFEEVTIKEEIVLKYEYLNIPLMVKYYVAQGFSLEAGPQVGFLLSAKYNQEVTSTSRVERISVSNDDDIESVKGVDFGLNFGAGYQLEMGLFFQARYNLGLSNIYDGEDSDEIKIKNRVIALSVGYKF